MPTLEEWVKGVTAEEFPEAPFKLNACTTVLETKGFLEWLKVDTPAMIKYGSLRERRREAFTIWNIENSKRGKEASF